MNVAPRWLPGAGLALTWHNGIALLDEGVGEVAAEQIWQQLNDAAELGKFLETLAASTGTSLLELPPFAIAITYPDRCHLAVRGAVSVELVTGTGAETLAGAGVTTWAERTVPDFERLVLSFETAAGETSFPMPAGIAPAAGVRLDLNEPAVAKLPGRAAAAPISPPPVVPAGSAMRSASDEPEPAAGESEIPVSTPIDPAAEPAPITATPTGAPIVATPFAADQDVEDVAPGPPPPADRPETPAELAEGAKTGVEPDEGVDSALGTETASELDHGTETAAEDEELPHDSAATRVEEATSLPEPEDLPPAPPKENPYDLLFGETMAADVYSAAIRENEGEEAQEAGPTDAERQQLEGETIADEGEVAISMSPAPGVPQVLSRFCNSGHPNPPERSECYVCGAPVVGEPRLAPRPQLGWLRVEGGETVAIEGPIIAGRNPKSTAVKAVEDSRLVALPYPHVSSNHFAIIPEGWRVLVRDLGSSNGSFLRRHGKAPIRLPDSAYPLIAGDLLDLGKGVFIRLDRIP